MQVVLRMVPFATVAALFATVAAAAPSSRFVFGSYLNTPYINTQPLVAAGDDGSSYVAGWQNAVINAPLHDGGPFPDKVPFLMKASKEGATIFSYGFQGAGGTVYAMAIGPSGDIYVAGSPNATRAVNAFDFQFPGRPAISATNGALSSTSASGYIARFKPDGTLVFVATIPATPSAIAVDSAGAAWVTGIPSGLQATPNAFQKSAPRKVCGDSCSSAFVAQLAADGSSLLYASFLGGGGIDSGVGIAVGADGSISVVGTTTSGDFPLAGAGSSSPRGGQDIFVSRFDASGSRLLSSTVFGGSLNDVAVAFAIGATGAAYVTGTTSSTDFPVTSGAVQAKYGGGATDAFLTKVGPDGGILFSTYLGGSGADYAYSMALGPDGHLYLTISGNLIDSTLLGQTPAACAPLAVLVAIDGTTSQITDFEPLIGFGLYRHTITASIDGLIHVVAGSATQASLIMTDGQPHFDSSSLLLARIDFSRQDNFQPACVINAADQAEIRSYEFAQGTALSPGSIISIQGSGVGPAAAWNAQSGSPLPDILDDLQVTLDGKPLPLLSASQQEVRAIVPYSQPVSKTSALAIIKGSSRVSIYGYVAPIGGSIFTRDSSGIAAALNEDGTVNSPENPAARGSIVSLFITGMGPLAPSLPDNAWTPMDTSPYTTTTQPIVYIQSPVSSGAAGMPVAYSGPAPGEAPGVYQLNVQIPELALTGKPQIKMLWIVDSYGSVYPTSFQTPWISVK